MDGAGRYHPLTLYDKMDNLQLQIKTLIERKFSVLLENKQILGKIFSYFNIVRAYNQPTNPTKFSKTPLYKGKMTGGLDGFNPPSIHLEPTSVPDTSSLAYTTLFRTTL